jgi:hypothetical protein
MEKSTINAVVRITSGKVIFPPTGPTQYNIEPVSQ